MYPSTHFPRHYRLRNGVKDVVEQLLDAVFQQTGLVGSVILAGPNPERGGELMTMSCVPSSLLLA
jgi:hypothetical protein